MDLTIVNDAARAIHLLGLALGFGVGIVADLSAARMVFRPLEDRDIRNLEDFHRIVTFGLVLLWASGLVLLWLRTGFQPENFSPKLMTKIGVVLLLTMNAIAIGRIGMPTMVAYQEWRFGELPLSMRAQLASLATISAACWISALALGVFSALKPMPWETLSVLVGVVYLIALGAALVAALFTPVVSFIARRLQDRPRMLHEGAVRY